MPRPLSRLATLAGSLGTHGTGAIEFALVAPMLMALLIGIFAYGYWLTVDHGLQQLAGEAARASVAGITDAERDALARGAVATGVPAYGLIDPTRLQVATSATGGTFQVALTYDMREFARFGSLVPVPGPELRRAAVVQRGGY